MLGHVSHELVQVAQNLGVQADTLLECIKQGSLPFTKAGKSIFIGDEDLALFLQRCIRIKDKGARALSQEEETLLSHVEAYLARRREAEAQMTRIFPLFFVLIMMTLWSIPAIALSGNLSLSDQRLIQRWVLERDRAAATYLLLWLRGAPFRKQAAPAAALLSYEVNIVTFCLGEEQLLEQYALLWGKEVNEKTLSVVLLEVRYGVDLGIASLFTSRSSASSLRQRQSFTPKHYSATPERGLVWEVIGRTLTLPTDLFLFVGGLGLRLIEPGEESPR
jgi:excisionase family DNA binding protein